MSCNITTGGAGCEGTSPVGLENASYAPPGRAVRAPLTPIPVTGPFDRVGVDVIQFPRSALGNQYAVVFVDYMTKWREVFPVSDQSVATIANLLVREIVSLHGVPSEILSDRGRAFLSGLLQQLLRYKKINTSTYHPQTSRN